MVLGMAGIFRLHCWSWGQVVYHHFLAILIAIWTIWWLIAQETAQGKLKRLTQLSCDCAQSSRDITCPDVSIATVIRQILMDLIISGSNTTNGMECESRTSNPPGFCHG